MAVLSMTTQVYGHPERLQHDMTQAVGLQRDAGLNGQVADHT